MWHMLSRAQRSGLEVCGVSPSGIFVTDSTMLQLAALWN